MLSLRHMRAPRLLPYAHYLINVSLALVFGEKQRRLVFFSQSLCYIRNLEENRNFREGRLFAFLLLTPCPILHWYEFTRADTSSETIADHENPVDGFASVQRHFFSGCRWFSAAQGWNCNSRENSPTLGCFELANVIYYILQPMGITQSLFLLKISTKV